MKLMFLLDGCNSKVMSTKIDKYIKEYKYKLIIPRIIRK